MNEYYFPHSTVEEFSTDQSSAIIVVKNVGYKDGLVKLKVTVQDFNLLQENKGTEKNVFEAIDELEMVAPTGEALDVSWDDASFSALIQWNFFQPRKILTLSYKVHGKNVLVDVGEPYPDNR